MENQPDYISLKEAASVLGVSKPKVSRLVAQGTLRTIPNPLDNREKLVKREDVQRLILKPRERAA